MSSSGKIAFCFPGQGSIEEGMCRDIAEVVATWTGVPVSRLMETEMTKLVRSEIVKWAKVVQDAGAKVEAILGDKGVRAVRVRDREGQRFTLPADCVLLSGGHTPATALAAQQI